MSILKKLSVLACVLLSVATVASADEGLYFAPEVGYVLPTDGNVDDAVFVGGKIGYDIDSNFAVEIESGWMNPAYDISGGPQNIDIDVAPVLFNVRYNGEKCADSDLGWYVFGGVGAAFNHLQSNDAGLDLDNTVAWQVGVGLDMPIADKTSAFIDARYFWNQPDLDSNSALLNAIDANDVNLQAVLFVVGIKL